MDAENLKPGLPSDPVEHYRSRAAALQQEEEKLKSTMDPEVRSIVSSKHITLFEKMLRDAGVQNPSLGTG